MYEIITFKFFLGVHMIEVTYHVAKDVWADAPKSSNRLEIQINDFGRAWENQSKAITGILFANGFSITDTYRSAVKTVIAYREHNPVNEIALEALTDGSVHRTIQS